MWKDFIVRGEGGVCERLSECIMNYGRKICFFYYKVGRIFFYLRFEFFFIVIRKWCCKYKGIIVSIVVRGVIEKG